MPDRFYAICNCCKCCCCGIEWMVKYGSPMLASSGYVAPVDETLCAACGTCVDACPFEAPSVGRGECGKLGQMHGVWCVFQGPQSW
ncbi:MAG: 4Fe-4S binding protein [Syntrophobacteraceae bacterium]